MEDDAIPRCEEWRVSHPEACAMPDVCLMSTYDEHHGWIEHTHPAPYCCSAYCRRCNRLRLMDGVPPLAPNEWMTHHG